MNNMDFIKFASKVGVVILVLGVGLAVAGMIGFFVESDAANKPTIISGLVISAVGYILIASQNILVEEF